jgi:hypothetical protein
MDKNARNIEIGKLRRDNKEFSNLFQERLLEAREDFIRANDLDESNILSLHVDAVIFFSKKKIITDFGPVKFRLDKQYTSYIRYGKIEMFYNDGVLDIKPSNAYSEHRLGLCIHIIRIFQSIEDYNGYLLTYIAKFQQRYLQQKLAEQYYVPFGLGVGEYYKTNLELLAFLTNICLKEVISWTKIDG